MELSRRDFFRFTRNAATVVAVGGTIVGQALAASDEVSAAQNQTQYPDESNLPVLYDLITFTDQLKEACRGTPVPVSMTVNDAKVIYGGTGIDKKTRRPFGFITCLYDEFHYNDTFVRFKPQDLNNKHATKLRFHSMDSKTNVLCSTDNGFKFPAKLVYGVSDWDAKGLMADPTVIMKSNHPFDFADMNSFGDVLIVTNKTTYLRSGESFSDPKGENRKVVNKDTNAVPRGFTLDPLCLTDRMGNSVVAIGNVCDNEGKPVSGYLQTINLETGNNTIDLVLFDPAFPDFRILGGSKNGQAVFGLYYDTQINKYNGAIVTLFDGQTYRMNRKNIADGFKPVAVIPQFMMDDGIGIGFDTISKRYFAFDFQLMPWNLAVKAKQELQATRGNKYALKPARAAVRTLTA
jgi:hypothetical protein